MSEGDIRRATLAELGAMRRRGELYYNPDAPEGPDLGEDFWANAVVVEPAAERTSVHLKLDAAVFDFFKQGGKGHLTRMQNVLKAYVEAQKRKVG
ncbi:MAG: BrnA antitoxin family protein [Beijerinckiaceae bacterium]|nr:BrnA antitoxin family protein [Beijerinckiaceae bacterium]